MRNVGLSRKLCLGTVQMGMYYGVNNTLGRQPSKDECFDILETALELDIDCFDTASAYGTSEKILGQFGLASKQTMDGTPVKIISKLRSGCENTTETVLRELRESLKRLQTKSLYGYMLHRVSDMHCKGIMHGLMECKAQGLTGRIGVSVNEPGEALEAIRDMRIELIQIPCNVLDTRWGKAGFFEQAEERGVEVHVRSVFLQGLLLMDPTQAAHKVPSTDKLIRMFQKTSYKYGFTPREAAFLYIYCQSDVSRLTFGVDSSRQLRENYMILSRIDSFEPCREALKNRFQFTDVAKNILMPSLWSKAR